MAIALITGASSGIGREFARQLAAAGEADGFWLIARNRERLEALAAELAVPCTVLEADLATEEGIAVVQEALLRDKPEIGWLVCAAGYGLFGEFTALPEREICGMIDVNVKALVRVTYAAIPYMRRGGHIVEMGSASCFTPLPNFNIYASSKAFVLHFGKALRYEVRPRGLTVTVFCPGWVDTAFLGKAQPEGAAGPREMKPLLAVEDVVRRAVRAAKRGRILCVTNWFTKLQHLLFKLLPDRVLTDAWMKMQR